MPAISATINLRDNFSNRLNDIINSMNDFAYHARSMQRVAESDIDTSPLDDMRERMSETTQEAERMNYAVNKISQIKPPDMSSTQRDYKRINTSVQNLNRYIRNNTESQNEFNRSVHSGSMGMSSLAGSIKSIAATYLSLQGIKSAIDISDTLTQTTARVNAMREALGETNALTDQMMDKIYRSAQDARGSYVDMAAMVARVGQNAKSAFSGSNEVIKFMNLIQKQMVLSGAATEEAKSAMLQLTQALASGTLRGDELNSVMEQAPGITQRIADYMNVDVGKIKEMASEGQITADIVKNAILSSEDEINEGFDKMPVTWGQAWISMKNMAVKVFEDVLEKINELANSEIFQKIADGAAKAFATLSTVANVVIDALGNAANFIVNNWSKITPVIYGAVAALAAYSVITGICSLATMAMNWPILLVSVAVGLLVAGIVLLARRVAQTGEVASTTFGVICGWINVVKEYFINFGHAAANIAIALWNVFSATCKNIKTAFKNSLNNVKAYFYDFGAVALRIISKIYSALNKLPFIQLDASGMAEAANDWAQKADALRGKNEKYVNPADEFKKGLTTYDMKIWTEDDTMNAYRAGAKKGDEFAQKIEDKYKEIMDKGKDDDDDGDDGDDPYKRLAEYLNNMNGGFGNSGGTAAADKLADVANGINNIAANTGSTAADTARIADSIDITDEDLKYLRDIAERDIIDRTVFTKVEVNMGGITNEVHGMTDLNEIADGINTILQEQICIGSEG